jgi:hypothetical protein
VQPGGGFQQVGVGAENGCQAAGPGGDALGVRPAAGKKLLQERPGKWFGQEASAFMRPRLGSCGGTCTGVVCRLKTS